MNGPTPCPNRCTKGVVMPKKAAAQRASRTRMAMGFSSAGSTLLRLTLSARGLSVQRRLQGLRKILRLTDAPVVEVDQLGRLVLHVAVDGDDVDTTRAQRVEDGLATWCS